MQYLGHTEHYKRAMAAWFRSPTDWPTLRDQPAQLASGEWELDGKYYVRLANVNGILAVYRIKPDGFLRRLKRWPKALEEDV